MRTFKLALPEWTGRLWCRLSIMFFILSMVCMAMLVVASSLIASSINNWRAFHARVNAPHVDALLKDQERLILSPMKEGIASSWPDSMAAQLAAMLARMEGPDADGLPYSIDLSSNPNVDVTISGRGGTRSIHFATDDRHVFPEDAIVVTHPVANADNERVGSVTVKLDARFDRLLDARNALSWAVNVWLIFVVSSAVMGIVFGLVAAKYVTSRLRVMNLVTEEWRRGRFGARITLGSDDELTIHSQRLNHMAQELELLFALKQSMAAGDERNRVARELHDTVKQKLFALSLQLEVLKTKRDVMAVAAEPVLEAETITREAQSDLMEIITQLRPAAVAETSFKDHITMLAGDYRRRFGVRIDVSAMETGPHGIDIEHHLVRIVQEALMNAVQHGKATDVSIVARVDDRRSVLTIGDNGEGFDPDKQTGGFGLISMRDRVSDLPQGRFTLESHIGRGTRITISWINEP